MAMLLNLDDEYAFGLLAMSCSPGGGGSNVYAHLLRGDLDLSITMTFFSTLLSLGKNISCVSTLVTNLT